MVGELRVGVVCLLIGVAGCSKDSAAERDSCATDGDCETGLVCCAASDEPLGVCLPECTGRGDGGRDAGHDAGRDAGVDAGRDAGVDAGPLPLPDVVDTPGMPERPFSLPNVFPEGHDPLRSLEPPAIIVPGAGDVGVYRLATGEELALFGAWDESYASVPLRDDSGALFLLTVGSAGARINACTDSGVSAFGQLLYPTSERNVTDAVPVIVDGEPRGAVITDNTYGAIEWVTTSDFGGFELDTARRTSMPTSDSGGLAVSAAAPSGDSPVLVAVDGTPGVLYWVDWAAGTPTMEEIGDLGDSPRLMGCSPGGRVCFVPSYASHTVTIVDIADPPTIRETVDVSMGPVSVDVAVIDEAVVAVTAGFVGGELTYIVDAGSSPTLVTQPLTGCASPGHARLIPDYGWVVITCHADGKYVVREIPSDVP